MSFPNRLLLVLALLLVAPLAPVVAADPAGPSRSELVLGRVSDNPKDDYGRLRPILDYVVPRMGAVGIRSGRILMARDPQQMLSYLRRGKVDWLTETPGSAVTYRERVGAQVLLLTERGGQSRYQSVLFARVDSGIRSLADLRGRSIGFQNNASTSAYFLPAIEILGAGLPLVVLASPFDRPSADVVGFVFARSELNISTWVHKGLVDAGAFSEQDWQDLEHLPEAFRADLQVFHRSGFVPRAMEVVRGDLDPQVAGRLREVLLGAATDSEAGPALHALWRTTRFSEVDDESARALDIFGIGAQRIRTEVE